MDLALRGLILDALLRRDELEVAPLLLEITTDFSEHGFKFSKLVSRERKG